MKSLSPPPVIPSPHAVCESTCHRSQYVKMKLLSTCNWEACLPFINSYTIEAGGKHCFY